MGGNQTFALADLLVIILLGRGEQVTLLSFVDADDYFRHCGLLVDTPERLRKLAAERPDPAGGGQAVAARLLAIRTLGERKVVAARAVLEAIAKAEAGLTRQYAERALAALDGKEIVHAAMPRGGLAADAAGSLPADTGLMFAVDFRGIPRTFAVEPALLSSVRLASANDGARGGWYLSVGAMLIADQLGDYRFDRLVVGQDSVTADGLLSKDSRRHVTVITGQGIDPELQRRATVRLFETLSQDLPRVVRHAELGGESFRDGKSEDIVFLRGNEDIRHFHWSTPTRNSRAPEAFQAVSDVLTGKAKSFADGEFAADIRAAPPGTFLMVVGRLHPPVKWRDLPDVKARLVRCTMSSADGVVAVKLTLEYSAPEHAETARKKLAGEFESLARECQGEPLRKRIGAEAADELEAVVDKIRPTCEGREMRLETSFPDALLARGVHAWLYGKFALD